jgi:hypothetical protein
MLNDDALPDTIKHERCSPADDRSAGGVQRCFLDVHLVQGESESPAQWAGRRRGMGRCPATRTGGGDQDWRRRKRIRQVHCRCCIRIQHSLKGTSLAGACRPGRRLPLQAAAGAGCCCACRAGRAGPAQGQGTPADGAWSTRLAPGCGLRGPLAKGREGSHAVVSTIHSRRPPFLVMAHGEAASIQNLSFRGLLFTTRCCLGARYFPAHGGK